MARNSRPWQERLTFLTPAAVEHVVCGKTLRFYPISVDLITELRHFIAPLAETIMVLLTNTRSDTGVQQESIDDQKERVSTRRTIMEGISPELAKHRDGQKSEAVMKLLEALFAEQTALVVASLIIDSLRDEFSRADARDPQVAEQFLKGDDNRPGLDARTMVEFLVGWAKANKEVMGPLGLDAVRELAAKRLSELTSRESGGVENLPSPSGPQKTENSGASSQTPSSSPSPLAIVPSGS